MKGRGVRLFLLLQRALCRHHHQPFHLSMLESGTGGDGLFYATTGEARSMENTYVAFVVFVG